jgi:hypothetical protein
MFVDMGKHVHMALAFWLVVHSFPFFLLQALSMGCCALAVLWNYQFLSCKLGELHINAW